MFLPKNKSRHYTFLIVSTCNIIVLLLLILNYFVTSAVIIKIIIIKYPNNFVEHAAYSNVETLKTYCLKMKNNLVVKCNKPGYVLAYCLY